MTTVFAGAQLDRAPGPQYKRALQFAEIALRAPLPKAGTLGKWRENISESFAISLVAPKSSVSGSLGPMRFDSILGTNVKWLDDAATALRARFIVIPTGADLTTGQRDRDLLAAYVDKLRKKDSTKRDIVWAPTGLWEPPAASKQAERLGILYAFDPIDAPVPVGERVYARLTAFGARSRFNENMLREVLEAVAEDDIKEAFIAIESPRSFKEASRLQQLANDENEDTFDDDDEVDKTADSDE
ncbi:MAG: hypothetical protein IPK60_19170 [Sandaracinaceae bacterium]|nr:hypothetical protein [Sandaracinaceae bacterium]